MRKDIRREIRLYIYRDQKTNYFSTDFHYRTRLDANPHNVSRHKNWSQIKQEDNRSIQGVPQSQTAALPRHQEEKETDKTKQAQIEETYEKH